VNDFVPAAVATLLIKDNKLLLGKRFTENQFAGWQCPGGFLHKGETVEAAGRRYCLHKAGLEINRIRPGPYTNNVFSEQQHTITLYLIAENFHIKNTGLFADEKIQWSWFAMNDLPAPLFLPLELIFSPETGQII